MEQAKEKMKLWNVIKMAGAWISFCIGSAFATGTGIMQVYGSHGKMAYAIIPISMGMFIYFVVSFFKLGFKGICNNSIEIFEYYCGRKVGMVFRVLTIVFMFLSPTCMISGFGATLSEYFGIPPYVGSLIMGTFCLLTVLLGLKRLVDIVGVVGPVIIVLTLFIGGVSVLGNWNGFEEGVDYQDLESNLPRKTVLTEQENLSRLRQWTYLRSRRLRSFCIYLKKSNKIG